MRLSSAMAAQNSIVLNFTGALDGTSARNATNFTVLLGGEEVAIGNAIYSENTVTLSGFNFAAGDKIELQISGLRDAEGKTLKGGTIHLSAR